MAFALLIGTIIITGCEKAATSKASSTSADKKIDPTGVFSGNALMGPSTYIIRSNFTYVFRGGSEVNSGTWSLSGNRLTFRRGGGQYQMRISDDGNVLGDILKRK